METYIADDGSERCDYCNADVSECTCCCATCGDGVMECACPEGPQYTV